MLRSSIFSLFKPQLIAGILVCALSLLATLTVALELNTASAVQTVPTRMNFQGRLSDAGGNIKPNGSYNMRLKLYTVSSGGSPVWSEDRLVAASQGVAVTNGLFSIQLGSVTSLPASLFASGEVYLEVELPTPASASTSSPVWSEGPMTPRNQMATSAYAYNAEALDGQDGSYYQDASNLNAGTVNSARLSGSYSGITGTGALSVGSIGTGFGTIVTGNTIQGSQLISTIPTGTAPIVVASTTLVTNLNADQLDGQTASFFQDASNLNAGTVGVARGGTGIASYAVGDMLYASGATTLGRLAAVASGSCLISQGVGTAPIWGSCSAGGITGSGTSGQVSYFNGTGSVTSSANLLFDGTLLTANSLTVSNSASVGGDLTVTGAVRAGVYRVGNSVERTFQVSFPNAVANQKFDLYFSRFWGQMEVNLTSSYNNQNAAGAIEKRYFLGLNPTNTIYTNTSRYSESSGATPANFALSDVTWDGAASRYRIQVVHRTSTGNTVYVTVKAHGASAIEADEIAQNMAASAVYTTDTTAFAAPTVSFTGNIGIGTASANALLQLDNSVTNRKLVLWEGANNDHQYYGFGINSSTLRYQVDSLTASHTFFAGSNATTSSELMRIQGNGNVGIGATAPSHKLQVAGNVYSSGAVYAENWLRTFGDTGWYSETYGGGWHMIDATWIRSYNGKYVYMAQGFDTAGASGVGCGGGLGGGYSFQVCGSQRITTTLNVDSTATFSGNIVYTNPFALSGTYLCRRASDSVIAMGSSCSLSSSARFKENVSSISAAKALDILSKLRAVGFDWRSGGGHSAANGGSADYGVIAEEVEQILPELVNKDANGQTVGVNYTGLIPFLIKAIQEQQSQIGKLQGGNPTYSSLAVNGPATIEKLTVMGDASVKGDIYIEGHLVSGGSTPTLDTTLLTCLDNVVVSGTDIAGTIRFSVSTAGCSSADLRVAFAKAYGAAPHATLTAKDRTSARAASSLDADTHKMTLSFDELEAGKTYRFTYHVIQ